MGNSLFKFWNVSKLPIVCRAALHYSWCICLMISCWTLLLGHKKWPIFLLIILVWSYICLVYSREPFIILSGGLSYDTVGRRPCLTVMHGKSTAVLEMDYSIVDFLTLCETPYPNGRHCKDFSLYFDLISLELYPIRIFLTIVLVLSLGIRLQQ